MGGVSFFSSKMTVDVVSVSLCFFSQVRGFTQFWLDKKHNLSSSLNDPERLLGTLSDTQIMI